MSVYKKRGQVNQRKAYAVSAKGIQRGALMRKRLLSRKKMEEISPVNKGKEKSLSS